MFASPSAGQHQGNGKEMNGMSTGIRKIGRLGAAGALSLAALGCALGPATTVAKAPAKTPDKKTKSFDVRAGTETTKGTARAWGTIKLDGKRDVRLTAKLDDVCPTDDFTAHVTVNVSLKDQTRNRTYDFTDDRKCGAKGSVPFKIDKSFDEKVDYVTINVWEYDEQKHVTGDSDWAYASLED